MGREIAEALDLMLHMIRVLGQRDQPSLEDIAEAQDLINSIKANPLLDDLAHSETIKGIIEDEMRAAEAHADAADAASY